MTIVVPNVGEEAMLDLILAEGYTLRLFTNDITADADYPDAVVASDFAEASFTGYSAKTLTGGAWTTTPDDPSVGEYAMQTFTRTSTGTAQLIRGYYVTRTTGGALRWYERFPGPITVELNGDAINVVPRFTLGDEEEPVVTARGAIAQFAATVNDPGSPYSATTTTDMVLSNVPVVAGRLYAIHLHSQLTLSGTGVWTVDLLVNGSLYDRFYRIDQTTPTATAEGTLYWEAPSTQSTDDFAVRATEASGTATLTLTGAGTARRTLTISDAGVAP